MYEYKLNLCVEVESLGTRLQFAAFTCYPFLQVVASKYMNDEGEMEALTNSDWAKLGTGKSPLRNLISVLSGSFTIIPSPFSFAGSMAKTTLDELERNFLRAIVSTTNHLLSSLWQSSLVLIVHLRLCMYWY